MEESVCCCEVEIEHNTVISSVSVFVALDLSGDILVRKFPCRIRKIEKYPKVPKSTQKYPKVPKSTQKYPKVPKSTQKYPKAPKSTQTTQTRYLSIQKSYDSDLNGE
jgi:hypothetical protein